MLTPELARQLYEQGESPYSIAEMYNTYPKKVQRYIKQAGGRMRSRQEAQRVAIDKGRNKCCEPMEDSVKEKISRAMVEHHKNMTEEQIEQKREHGKKCWSSMTEEQMQEFQKKSNKERIKSAKVGSKMERFL